MNGPPLNKKPPSGQGQWERTDNTTTLKGERSNFGWFRAYRSDDALELLRANKNAFALLYLIAHRAQWKSGFNRHNLELGQAFIGGRENHGLSEREYRTAKQQLEKWKFATFKATNKGTIATLINTSVFSIYNVSNDEQADSPTTNGRQSTDKQATTTNKSKEDKKGERLSSPRREFWQLQADKKRLETELQAEREKFKPNAKLIRRYRQELEATILEMTEMTESEPARPTNST